MLADRNRSEAATQNGGAFVTTHWSLVLAAGNSASEAAQPALETLCRTYWLPLYAFARRLGKSPEDASDLTQGFFARLLEKRWITTADPDRGRFRTFLLTAFRRYISGEDRSAGAENQRPSAPVMANFDLKGEPGLKPQMHQSEDRMAAGRLRFGATSRCQAGKTEEHESTGQPRAGFGNTPHQKTPNFAAWEL